MGETGMATAYDETLAQARCTLLDLGYAEDDLDLLVSHHLRLEEDAADRLGDAEVAAAVLMVAATAALRGDDVSVRLMIRRARSSERR
jgi:hypothetical protein